MLFVSLALWTVPAPSIFGASAQRDITFFLFSDVHVGAENLKARAAVTAAEPLAKTKANLDKMRSLVGQCYPAAPGRATENLGEIPVPQGMLILGDLTDGDKEASKQERQWAEFEALFPVAGVSFGDQKVPVFALPGNHDGDLGGPQRRGLVRRNRELNSLGRIAAVSSNGVHFALNWQGVHLVSLGLCAADTTDSEAPFKYGKPGRGSWNDPQGALSFLKGYLEGTVRNSGDPVILMQHYGFDGFSMNDWFWWTAKQRRVLYELLAPYNVAAILHGHNHHAEHYRWPDPKLHAADLNLYFDDKVPSGYRQYDVLSCGQLCWVVRIRGDSLTAAHYASAGWSTDSSGFFVKSLTNVASLNLSPITTAK